MSATRAAPPRQPASSAAVHRLTAWLQEAGVERTAGLCTLRLQMQQRSGPYCGQPIIALSCYGNTDDAFARCVAAAAKLVSGQAYVVAGQALAAADGHVYLLGVLSIQPAWLGGLLPATSHGAGPHADALLAASMPPGLQLDGVRT